ncbi:Hypothetical predicted protein [Lecanosticta acicola]|uniref:Nicotinamide N-methyltransferase n=1 Tax=Lecanosticta acicola TaxID=111012 RepID=A0AAI8Z3A0_9PEZI|nr:Hypothetical predicted protein [Lecanosticta acicola]
MPLTDLVSVIPPDIEDEPEDIFAAASGLFFNDFANQHGGERSTILYKSKKFGNIELRTADPEREHDRKLFAHYLWNAGIKLAELISGDKEEWTVRDEKVLELGAGVGLDGIIATLAGAREVVISDYPANALLDNILRNAEGAVPQSARSRYRIEGYEWGDDTSPFASSNAHSFGRILAADCFWMPHEHENLVKSMLHFLDWSHKARVFVVAGFHTGRAKLAGFFDEATLQGLAIEEIYEENAEGDRREWQKERDNGLENVTERKRWLVIAILGRQAS